MPRYETVPSGSATSDFAQCRYRRITSVEISKGTINECVAHPREILRPAIIHCAYAFVLVHNHPSGDPSPSDAGMRLTRRMQTKVRSSKRSSNVVIHFVNSCYGKPMANKNDNLPDAATVMKSKSF